MKKLVFALAIIFSSCQLVIDVPRPDFDSKLVLNGVYNVDSIFSVFISNDTYILDDDIHNGLSGVQVKLFENDVEIGVFSENVLELDSFNNINGTYELNYKPKPNEIYRIEASKEGFNSVQAESMISTNDLPKVLIGELDTTGYTDAWSGNGNWHPLYSLNIELDDTASDNYYLLNLYRDEYVPEYFYDSVFNHFEYDSIIGYIKIFQKVRITPKNAIFENQNWSAGNTIFDDETFNGQKFNLQIDFAPSFARYFRNSNIQLPITEYYLELQTLSEEHFEHLKSLYIQTSTQGDIFAEPIQVYSNIENGFGIFAGYHSQWITFTQ